jgi:hypothetical protein
MSGENKPGGYSPSTRPARLTVDEYQRIGDSFKEWFEGTHLKWWIVAAGVGGIAELLHVLWDSLLWVYGRMPH